VCKGRWDIIIAPPVERKAAVRAMPIAPAIPRSFVRAEKPTNGNTNSERMIGKR